MEISEKLSRLFLSLKERNRPRDDTLLSKLSTTFAEYCNRHDFNPEIVNTEIFDAEQLQNVDSDIQSFFLQLAGHYGRLCDEDSGDLAKIYGFLIEAMRINSSDTSILCGWLKAMEIVISKHTRKQLSSEILSHIHQCLSDKRYFVSKTSLSLVEQLMDNSFANRDLEYHIRAVEFLLSSAVQDFKNSIHDTSSLQVMLSLMEKMISLGKSNSCNSEVPLSWMSLFSQEVVDNINQTLSKLLRGNSLEIDRILQVLYGMLSMKGCNLVALPVEEIDKILKNLLLTDDKIKALYVAEWMMRNPSFRHLREQLECLCLSPLMHEVGDCQEMTSLEEYHFVNSSFDSEILCLVFKIVGRCEVQQPFKVFDTCLRFLKEICFDVDARSRHPSKCIRVCLEALNSLASKIAGTPSNDHKSILVNLLDVFHEDHLTVSRIFKIIENVSASFTSDEESSSKLFASLSRLIQNVKWDTRDSVITFIRHLYTLNISTSFFQLTIRCNLHKMVWQSLEDEEPYVRAAAVESLGALLGCCQRLGTETEITQKFALEKVTLMVQSDEEAFARRSAVVFVTGFISSNVNLLFPCLCLRNLREDTKSDSITKWLNVGHLLELLASAGSNDPDWEVKIPVLKFFSHLLLDVLFHHIWSYYKNRQLCNVAGEVDVECHRLDSTISASESHLSKLELDIVSLALRKVLEACDDCDSSVQDVAKSIIGSVEEKLKEVSDEVVRTSSCELHNFVSCFNGDIKILEILKSASATEDRKPDLSEELSSILDDIEMCMMPYVPPKDDYWTSDEEEYLDFGLVDCY